MMSNRVKTTLGLRKAINKRRSPKEKFSASKILATLNDNIVYWKITEGLHRQGGRQAMTPFYMLNLYCRNIPALEVVAEVISSTLNLQGNNHYMDPLRSKYRYFFVDTSRKVDVTMYCRNASQQRRNYTPAKGLIPSYLRPFTSK